jgi:hypothetical protein
MFQKRMLRRIFRPNGDEVTGGRRKLHTEELHNLYSSPSIISMIKAKRTKWARHVVRMEEKRTAYGILVGEPEGKRTLGRPRRKWVDNIKMNLREIGCGGIDWIDRARYRDQWRARVNTLMNPRVA